MARYRGRYERSRQQHHRRPWSATRLHHGITVDPLQWVNWSGETLIDSVRIYRGGHLSVTYLCDGEIIGIDGNRGAGVGYVLRDDIPLEKEGYTFAGWSLTENGPVTKTIDLADDTTVYAVFTDKTIDFGEGGGKAIVTVGEEAGDNVNLIAALYDASGLACRKDRRERPAGHLCGQLRRLCRQDRQALRLRRLRPLRSACRKRRGEGRLTPFFRTSPGAAHPCRSFPFAPKSVIFTKKMF